VSSGGVKVIDHGYAALKKRLAEASAGTRLTVGIHEAEGDQPAEGDDSGATLAEVAAYNEFGGPEDNPPRRSFLADWADGAVDENRELVRRSMKAVVQGKLPSLRVAFERLGLRFVGEIQLRIKAGIEPENAESTIARKGSSTPLIGVSGQLFTSVTHEVTEGTE
jgi:hypothetical protein